MPTTQQRARLSLPAVILGLSVFGMLLGVVARPDREAKASSDEPDLFLESTISIDLRAGTVTLPLFEGRTAGGKQVWYVITDSSYRADARRLGVTWSPKLANAIGTKSVQGGKEVDGRVEFAATVDFKPDRVVKPNPDTGFPPEEAKPGSVGEEGYSPLVSVRRGRVLNAPHVANDTGTHDKVVAIDYDRRTVTLALTPGFVEGDPIYYLSTEASDPTIAALEGATYAAALNDAPGLADNDADGSARSALIAIVNGPTGANNPARQGLESALLGEGAPLNILDNYPEDDDYSPLWDVHPAVWTAAAIKAGGRALIDDHDDVADLFEDGLLTSGAAEGTPNRALGGLPAAGVVVNCPAIAMP